MLLRPSHILSQFVFFDAEGYDWQDSDQEEQSEVGKHIDLASKALDSHVLEDHYDGNHHEWGHADCLNRKDVQQFKA